MKRSLQIECLESRISLSSFNDPIITVNVPVATGIIPVPVYLYPERDPGALPPDQLILPSVPSGPVGPGASAALPIHALTV